MLQVIKRNPNTDRNGNPWTSQQKLAIWQKGRIIPNYPDSEWRLDTCGQVMQWSQHGNRNSTTGWEIDHINPVNNGGGDDLNNLQPLNWANNSRKGDTLNWRCGQ